MLMAGTPQPGPMTLADDMGCRETAAQSNQAVRLALGEQGRQRLTARRELAAVVPIG